MWEYHKAYTHACLVARLAEICGFHLNMVFIEYFFLTKILMFGHQSFIISNIRRYNLISYCKDALFGFMIDCVLGPSLG